MILNRRLLGITQLDVRILNLKLNICCLFERFLRRNFHYGKLKRLPLLVDTRSTIPLDFGILNPRLKICIGLKHSDLLQLQQICFICRANDDRLIHEKIVVLDLQIIQDSSPKVIRTGLFKCLILLTHVSTKFNQFYNHIELHLHIYYKSNI